jgi:hypothetical protein
MFESVGLEVTPTVCIRSLHMHLANFDCACGDPLEITLYQSEKEETLDLDYVANSTAFCNRCHSRYYLEHKDGRFNIKMLNINNE